MAEVPQEGDEDKREEEKEPKHKGQGKKSVKPSSEEGEGKILEKGILTLIESNVERGKKVGPFFLFKHNFSFH